MESDLGENIASGCHRNVRGGDTSLGTANLMIIVEFTKRNTALLLRTTSCA